MPVERADSGFHLQLLVGEEMQHKKKTTRPHIIATMFRQPAHPRHICHCLLQLLSGTYKTKEEIQKAPKDDHPCNLTR